MHVTAGAKNTHCGHHSFLLSCFLPLNPACCAPSGDKEGQASGGVGLFGFWVFFSRDKVVKLFCFSARS